MYHKKLYHLRSIIPQIKMYFGPDTEDERDHLYHGKGKLIKFDTGVFT